ncbi:MAG: hypothetical protein AAF074_18770 [Pseudomonadota bacterium]
MRRRMLLLGLAAAGLAPAAGRGEVRLLDPATVAAVHRAHAGARGARARVLFVGNSFTYEHDVPARVAALAEAAGRPIRVAMIAEGGARLADLLVRPGMAALLGEIGWDAVVLQDHSTTALFPAEAARSRAAIGAAAGRAAPAPVVLFTPWARAPGHALYRRRSTEAFRAPGSPAAMTAETAAAFRVAARGASAHVAPVATRWAEATAEGARLYGADGYHANAAGADLAAETLWATLAPLLPRAGESAVRTD